MFKFKHSTLIVIAGLIWLGVGIFLLTIGLKFVVASSKSLAVEELTSLPFINGLSVYLGSPENAGILIIACALLLGYVKGKVALTKSAIRAVKRIRSFSAPISLHRIYSIPFLILILGMITLGVLIKVFNVPQDIRGFVDIVIGAALIKGAMVYFKLATEQKAVLDP